MEPALDERTISCPRCHQLTLVVRITARRPCGTDCDCEEVDGSLDALCTCLLSEDEVTAVLSGVQAALQREFDEEHAS